MAQNLPVLADPVAVPTMTHSSPLPSSQTSPAMPEEMTSEMTQPGVQLDPLDSPHPIPWNWVLAAHAEISASERAGLRYYRSQSLVSPDGQYAAYSRIQLRGQPSLYRSRVTSVMFLENLETGDLRTITASSPLADNPLTENEEAKQPGTIAILMPVSWSESGDRILARQFEGRFSTSDASDYAVIWERRDNHTRTLAPERVQYTNAILLGWSRANPESVLFRAGELGAERWPVWAVKPDGHTALAFDEEPVVYGEMVNQVWAGPQAYW